MVLAHPTTDHEKVRPEQLLHRLVVALEPGHVLVEAELLPLPHGGGSEGLRVLPVDLQVADLRVGEQFVPVDDRGAYARAEGGDDHEALVPLRGAEDDLGHPGRVGVVHDEDVPAECLAEDGLRGGVDPGLVDVGRGPRDAVGDHGGDGDADGAVTHLVGEGVHDLLDHERHVRGRGGLRRHDAQVVAGEFTGRQVDHRPLDPGTPDVDAEDVLVAHVELLVGEAVGEAVRGRPSEAVLSLGPRLRLRAPRHERFRARTGRWVE